MASNILKLLQEAVSLNTTGTVYKPLPTLVPKISSSPNEKAILSWAILSLDTSIDEVKQNYHTIHVETFNLEKKKKKKREREKKKWGFGEEEQ